MDPDLYGLTIYESDSVCGSQSLNVGQLARFPADGRFGGRAIYNPDVFKFVGSSQTALSNTIDLRDGLTFSYWFKFPFAVSQISTYSPGFASSVSSTPNTQSIIPVSWQTDPDGTPFWSFGTGFSSLIAAPNLIDNIWHNFTYCFEPKTCKMQFFLDGKSQGTVIGANAGKPISMLYLASDLGGGLPYVERQAFMDSIFLLNRVLYTSDFTPVVCNPTISISSNSLE